MSQIHTPTQFLKSGLYNGSLWKYPNGNLMGSDLDRIAERHGYFLIAESKKFNWDDEVTFPLGQLLMLKQLNKQLQRRKIFLVGTENYDARRTDDSIWFSTMDEVEQNKMPSVSGTSLVLNKSKMIKTTKERFNILGNNLVNGVF
jgi:hypothetical protein